MACALARILKTAPGMRIAIGICALLAWPVPGHADDNDKSEATATALAIGGSLAGPGLMLTGFVVAPQDSEGQGNAAARVPFEVAGMAFVLFGPSLGSWYAHEGLSTGLEVRLGGVAVIGLGIATNTGSGNVASKGLIAAGAGALLAGTVLDIVEAHRAAREYNEAHRPVAITPTVLVDRSGPLPGLAVGGRF